MYSAYGAHFPGRHPEAFGTDVEERYRWLFRFEPPRPGHRLREIVTGQDLTVVATTQYDDRLPARLTPHLFVLTDSCGGYQILASIQGTSPTIPRPGCGGRADLLGHIRTRLCATNATMLAVND
ncbi:hypothetical protein BJY24_004941 [Nocardia transvalensis]|uniref:Uncharacterized protein n=1 Tax=Nocardia transvalensis TaxID=37333 RepID=A0A7W9PH45_9NOCA|nr:hypothetical protein [Nocardia transvalensis]MBB5916029.1 hypothetical protein [Nocardia transvalensis]